MKKTVGIAGTAKNTGKTTTTIALINYFHNRGIALGLTSIGLDGETVDNVTGLPKPRLYVPKGTMVVTAERCIEASSAKVERVERLDVGTPLGKLICGIVEREGLVVMAGPNQSTHLRVVRDWLYAHGANLVIVDGALNRMAPMVETDGFVLATGAAFKRETFEVAYNAHCLAKICNLSDDVLNLVPTEILESRKTVLWKSDGSILVETDAALFKADQLNVVEPYASQARGFYCPGLISSSSLRKLMELEFPPDMVYLFSDPIKVIVGNDLTVVHDFLTNVHAKGGLVGYKNSLPLLAITVNPFYPKFRYDTNGYEPAYVDRNQLLADVAAWANIPVYDVVNDKCEELAEMLLVAK